MTNKTTMPAPVAYPTDEWVDEFFGTPDETGFYSFRGDFGNIAYRFKLAAQAGDFITTDQAEAYAASRVREALEEAAKVPRMYAESLDASLFSKRYPEQLTAIFNASTNMADRIRALIPQHDNE